MESPPKISESNPPTMKVPTELRLAEALIYLGIVRFPILLSSHLRLLSKTRQEEEVPCPYGPTFPPQVAMTGLGSDVQKVVCPDLGSGSGGGEQLLELGG